LSMVMLGVGYYLVGLAPTYGLILAALVFAHVGSAMWHPPALGLLSQRFPSRRGLVIAMHRSTGSLGDTAGPWVVGILLVALTWRGVLQGMLPVALLLGLVLWVFLWRVGGPKPGPISLKDNFQGQMASLRRAVRGAGLITLLAVSALRGMGDRALFLFIPLYLSQVLKMGTVGVGFHVGLLTLPAIVSGPVLGAISDRLGRKPLIVMALLVSCIFPLIIVLSSGLKPWLSIYGVDIGLMSAAIFLFGLFLYSVNSLVQAAAMDLAEGLKLEGTFIGMLWGNNALFGAFSPVIAGLLADWYGPEVPFFYAAAIFLIAGLLAVRLPLGTQHLRNREAP
ncbi:MAG: MFS transporter, partial [Dehalococcoidia bacterium]